MLAEHIHLVLLSAGAIGLCYLFAIGINPSSRLFRWMERSFAALSLLYLWNLATPAAMQLGINPVTLAFAALTGAPGVAAMSAVKMIQ